VTVDTSVKGIKRLAAGGSTAGLAGVLIAGIYVWGPDVSKAVATVIAQGRDVAVLQEQVMTLRRDNDALRGYSAYLAERITFYHGGAVPPPPAAPAEH